MHDLKSHHTIRDSIVAYDDRAVREVIREVQSSQCPPDARHSTDADIGRRLASTAATHSTSMPSPSSTSSDGGAPASRSDMLASPSDPSTHTNPTRADSDRDGSSDGREDRNHNGRVDDGERDPLRRG